MTAVPRWVVVYATVGHPLLWFLHRVANGFMLYDERGKKSFYDLILLVVVWGLVSLVVTAVIYAGGVHAWAKPTGRPRLLRFGLGSSIAWSVLLVAFVILGLGATLAGPPAEDNHFGSPGDIAEGIAAALWVASFICDVIGRRQLRRMHLSSGRR